MSYVNCKCGSYIKESSMKSHLKTKKHLSANVKRTKQTKQTKQTKIRPYNPKPAPAYNNMLEIGLISPNIPDRHYMNQFYKYLTNPDSYIKDSPLNIIQDGNLKL